MTSAKSLDSAVGRWLLARPALSAAALLALGISLHDHLWRRPMAWLTLLLLLIAVSYELKKRPRISLAAMAVSIICAGVLVGQLAAYQFQPSQIGLFVGDQPRLACVELRFEQTPQFTPDEGPRHLGGKQSGRATVVAVKTVNGWQKSTGEVLFSLAQASPRLLAGQRVRVVGMLDRPAPAMNPGQFDWALHTRRERILASLRVNRACDVELMSAGFAPTFAEARVGVRDWLALGFSPRHQADRALLQALMLGDRSPDLRDIERNFQKTGTSHLLSSSGVRMAVLAAMAYFLCRLVRVRPRVMTVAVAISLLGWGCVTLYTPQALRPVIVAAVVGIGLIRRRTGDSIQHLAFAAMVIMIAQPLDIYSPGFQFSFIIVLGMLLLIRPLVDSFNPLDDPDAATLARFGKQTPMQRLRQKCVKRGRQILAASLVAWLVSIPLVAYHFEQFTPWAVPLGILLSPVVFAALGLGFFKLIATMLFPSMAPAWAAIATVPVAILRTAMALAAHLPMADIPVAQPPVWGIVLFYLLLCLPLLPFAGRRIRWSLRCGPLAACAVVLLLPPLLGLTSQSASTGTVRITLLSIGAGQCAVIEPPGEEALMVDAGSTTIADPLHETIGPFLHHELRRSMQRIYLSHGDYDHISATEGAVQEYGVRNVTTTPFFRKHADESAPCRHLLEFLDHTGHSPTEVVAGDTLEFGSGVAGEVLWPPKQCEMNSNNAGMVIKMIYAGRSILFPADIQDPAMRELLKNPARLRADVLVAPHHGSSEPLTAEFVQAVQPSAIVSSNSARLTKKQRDFEQTIEHRPLYRTSQCGAVTIEIDRTGRLTITPFLPGSQPAIAIERDGTFHVVR